MAESTDLERESNGSTSREAKTKSGKKSLPVNRTNEFVHRNPFEFMEIDDNKFLHDIDNRSPCIKCNKSRKFFCYNCYLPVAELQSNLPKVKLPLQIDIIKHHKEIDGKSTAIHAAILAPDNVKIYTYPDIPDYSADNDTILIFPTHDSVHVDGIFDEHVRLETADELNIPKGVNRGTLLKCRRNEVTNGEKVRNESLYTLDNLPIRRAVFIDSTWNQSRGIYKDPRINRMRTVVLQNRLSQFWRHQKGSPRWFLATIEAIHQFLLEFHINAWGLDKSYRALEPLEIQTDFIRKEFIIEQDENTEETSSLTVPYNGQYDNLFFFFTYMYHLIHEYYDHNILMAYRRPIL